MGADPFAGSKESHTVNDDDDEEDEVPLVGTKKNLLGAGGGAAAVEVKAKDASASDGKMRQAVGGSRSTVVRARRGVEVLKEGGPVCRGLV
ncbi:hypothetical protein HDV00_007975 [Rhizophlyctis rosea]|nr:hypothetical protein HDV00_007975 [Rhizophlyctis rosea]